MSVSNQMLFKKLTKQISALNSEYPKIRDQIHNDRFSLRDYDEQEKRAADLGIELAENHNCSWHKNVFFPDVFIRNIVQANNIHRIKKQVDDFGELSKDLITELDLDIKRIQFFSSWETTKGIYSVDKTLSRSIFNEFIDAEKDVLNFFPSNLIEYIPEWCMYFKFENTELFELFDTRISGFFVLINQYSSKSRELVGFDCYEMCFLFHGIDSGFLPLDIPMNESIPFYVLTIETIKHFTGRKLSAVELITITEMVNQAISMVIYSCTQKPEYSGSKPSFPTPAKTKKGLRFFPPEKPKIIEIGKTIGEKLRQHEAAQEKEYVESGATKRPHIRRGHWSRYWTGSKNTETPQTLKYNWIPPIGVNIEGGI